LNLFFISYVNISSLIAYISKWTSKSVVPFLAHALVAAIFSSQRTSILQPEWFWTHFLEQGKGKLENQGASKAFCSVIYVYKFLALSWDFIHTPASLFTQFNSLFKPLSNLVFLARSFIWIHCHIRSSIKEHENSHWYSANVIVTIGVRKERKSEK
jgi:hypothetical protein